MRAFALGSLLIACGPIVDDSDSAAADSGDGTTTAVVSTMTAPADDGSGMTQATTSPMTSATSVTVTSASDTATVTTDDATATGAESTGSLGTSDTGEPRACIPAPDEDACVACTRTSCCDEIEACTAQDAGCPCVLDCVLVFDDPQPAEAMQCSEECGVDFIVIVPTLLEIVNCRAANCADTCG